MRLRYLAVTLFAAGALVCAYFVGRSQGPENASERAAVTAQDAAVEARTPSERARFIAAPLPARGLPLRQVFSNLQARADAGDLAAATRLYRDLRLCGSLDGLDWSFARLADELLDQKVDATDKQTMENYKVQLDGIEARKQVMRKFHSLCDGVDRRMLDSQLSSMRKAAELGDDEARACYLMRGPNYDSRGLMRHPEWIETYRKSARSFLDAGLASGDWKVVDLLRRAYQPGSDNPLAGVLGSDPLLYYRYLKLYRLGAEATRVAQIDQQLAAAAAQIAPEQRADADLWAQTSFQRDFDSGNSTATTPDGWNPCSLSFDPL
jgi:hypothetical protein